MFFIPVLGVCALALGEIWAPESQLQSCSLERLISINCPNFPF